MNEVLNVEVYFSSFFVWFRSVMLNTFALESSVLMLLNISLSNSTGRARALFERRDSESSKCSKQPTMGGRGRMRSTRNRGTREKTRENKTKRRRHRAAKGRRVKERKEGTRESVRRHSVAARCSKFVGCCLLNLGKSLHA